MSKQIDAYSFALGVCEAFCEVVRAGVKRIALSHPFTEDELQNALGADFLPACEAVARKYGCKAYYLKEPLITDLFPVSLNRSKQNIVFYREDRDLKEFLSIQHDKQTLYGRKPPPNRRALRASALVQRRSHRPLFIAKYRTRVIKGAPLCP